MFYLRERLGANQAQVDGIQQSVKQLVRKQKIWNDYCVQLFFKGKKQIRIINCLTVSQIEVVYQFKKLQIRIKNVDYLSKCVQNRNKKTHEKILNNK